MLFVSRLLTGRWKKASGLLCAGAKAEEVPAEGAQEGNDSNIYADECAGDAGK